MLHHLPLSSVITEIQRVRKNRPLVHCLTNEVVQNFTANALIALNISPAMVVAIEELAEFIPKVNGLLINIGTPYGERSKAMLEAARIASESTIPWVLDPVAVSATQYRAQLALNLCNLNPQVIRANAAEILFLNGDSSTLHGTDSHNSSDEALSAAKSLALRYKNIIALTGQNDYITDGVTTYKLQYGSSLLANITGSGCILSALCAGFIANSPNPLLSIASACATSRLSSTVAARRSQGIGTFEPHYLDTLYHSPANFEFSNDE